jgi:hypothetical protein
MIGEFCAPPNAHIEAAGQVKPILVGAGFLARAIYVHQVRARQQVWAASDSPAC